MGAIVARERYGVGQHIECSQLGAMTMFQGLGITAALHTGRENNSGNHGHMTPNAHFTWYKCSDGKYMTVCALAANQWESFCDAIEKPEYKEAWQTMNGTMYAGAVRRRAQPSPSSAAPASGRSTARPETQQ